MPQRLVVSFRSALAPEAGGEDRYLQRAFALKKRAEALGATLCAWSANTLSFSLDPLELEEAVVLATLALDVSVAEERFGAAIAEGEMTPVGDLGSFAALAWGPPLVVAEALAWEAKPGEVLLDGELLAIREAEITRLDAVQLDLPGRRLVTRLGTAATLAPPAPSSNSAGLISSVGPTLRNPPLSPPRRLIARRNDSAPPSATVDGGRARRPPTIPPPAEIGPLSARGGAIPRFPPPPPVMRRSAELGLPEEPRRADPPPPDGVAATPDTSRALIPPDIASLLPGGRRRKAPSSPEIVDATPEPIADLAKRALVQGDTGALERVIGQLRETGSHGELIERMAALVALRRGATGEALRRLRDAADGVREPAQQARARLAYGVALASAGRTESALLEVLEALARARASGDVPGERACALFLARLSASAGHPEAASAWAIVAARCAAPPQP